jgi:hypothetical protein
MPAFKEKNLHDCTTARLQDRKTARPISVFHPTLIKQNLFPFVIFADMTK